MEYRKKPVVVEAVKVLAADFNGSDWDGSPLEEAPQWILSALSSGVLSPEVRGHTDYCDWKIKTLEGVVYAIPGDFIIRGVKGELYPCRGDIFAETYEPKESSNG